MWEQVRNRERQPWGCPYLPCDRSGTSSTSQSLTSQRRGLGLVRKLVPLFNSGEFIFFGGSSSFSSYQTFKSKGWLFFGKPALLPGVTIAVTCFVAAPWQPSSALPCDLGEGVGRISGLWNGQRPAPERLSPSGPSLSSVTFIAESQKIVSALGLLLFTPPAWAACVLSWDNKGARDFLHSNSTSWTHISLGS